MKAQLTGAGGTSVAPVWLAQPQLHVLQERYAVSFGHELAHVFSRAFGLPVIRASVAVGLVEGLAVALEPPDGRPTPHEQVAVAVTRDTTRSWADWRSSTAARLSAFGFWTGRGAVSYTTMGSFVRFLLDRYGVDRFKRAYPWASLEAAYGKPVETLVAEWQEVLQRQPIIARSTEALVARRFARPSLFEQRCPHYVPPFRRAYDDGRRALRRRDSTRAAEHFERAVALQPRFVAAHERLASLRLARGASAAVIRQLDTLTVDPPSARLHVHLGDAWALQRRPARAIHHYAAAFHALPPYAHSGAAAAVLRRAVADAPAVVRILTAADSAHVQARRLAALPDAGPGRPRLGGAPLCRCAQRCGSRFAVARPPPADRPQRPGIHAGAPPAAAAGVARPERRAGRPPHGRAARARRGRCSVPGGWRLQRGAPDRRPV